MKKNLDRWILLLAALIVASLLLTMCDGSDDDDLVSTPTASDDSGPAFPTHDRPLPTDWGLGHVKLKLIEEDGCLRGLGHDLNEPNPSYLLVWPEGLELDYGGEVTSVRDQTGAVVASVERKSGYRAGISRPTACTPAGSHRAFPKDVWVPTT